MKEGLSGSIVNEIEVNDRWNEMRAEALRMLDRLKQKPEPPKFRKDQHTIESEGYRDLAKKIMKKRMNENYTNKT